MNIIFLNTGVGVLLLSLPLRTASVAIMTQMINAHLIPHTIAKTQEMRMADQQTKSSEQPTRTTNLQRENHLMLRVWYWVLKEHLIQVHRHMIKY